MPCCITAMLRCTAAIPDCSDAKLHCTRAMPHCTGTTPRCTGAGSARRRPQRALRPPENLQAACPSFPRSAHYPTVASCSFSFRGLGRFICGSACRFWGEVR
jgi:hypothetical protein